MSPSRTENISPSSYTTFGPGTRVAVIGAGVSGICSAAHLLKQGAEVTVFERSSVSSGVWHYNPRVTNSPSYPSEKPSAGDYRTTRPGQFAKTGKQSPNSPQGQAVQPLNNPKADDLQVAFAPPGPCYQGLRNNVPTSLLYSSLRPWPEGTEEIIGHLDIEKYLQGLSSDNGVDEVTLYNTRVEEARKSADGQSWVLRTVTLQKSGDNPPVLEETREFDALVVASGHYNLPRIPDIPGLTKLKEVCGDRIIHTKEYRDPEVYRDKTIFLIGGGTSAMDVCREADGKASRIIQSTRGGAFDLPVAFLPDSIERVVGVERFELDPEALSAKESNPSEPIKVRVHLTDGSVLEGIHNIILATGYITSYPYLPQFHNDDLDIDAAGAEVLVASDGTMVHNLHKDIFYIEDASLAFVGVPYYIATFSLFDFQAQAVARVFTGKTELAPRESLRREYEQRVTSKRRGRHFHSLAEEGAEVAYVKDLTDWVNKHTVDPDVEPAKGHTPQWIAAYKEFRDRRTRFRASNGDHPGAVTWPDQTK